MLVSLYLSEAAGVCQTRRIELSTERRIGSSSGELLKAKGSLHWEVDLEG